MRNDNGRLSRGLFAALLVLLLGACAAAREPQVYIVRHAEKADGNDPALTAAGSARAAALADLLADAQIARVYSTDTRRTRSTAAPLAERLGLAVTLYDHRDPAALAREIVAAGESALVVGHSNTIAELAAAFGVDPGPAVAEEEFDRLYVITLDEAGNGVERRRYGAE